MADEEYRYIVQEDHDEEAHGEHEHHHEHHHEERIHIDFHEGALIGAVRGVIPTADHDEAERLLACAMKDAAARINALEGIIGHIKFVVITDGAASQISVTDEEESIRRFDGTSSRAEGVAIVFNIAEEALHEILEETVCALFPEEEDHDED